MNFSTEKDACCANGPKIKVVRVGMDGESSMQDIGSILGNCCGTGFERRYKSKEEKVQGLEAYLKEIEAEAVAVREAIADLKTA